MYWGMSVLYRVYVVDSVYFTESVQVPLGIKSTPYSHNKKLHVSSSCHTVIIINRGCFSRQGGGIQIFQRRQRVERVCAPLQGSALLKHKSALRASTRRVAVSHLRGNFCWVRAYSCMIRGPVRAIAHGTLER